MLHRESPLKSFIPRNVFFCFFAAIAFVLAFGHIFSGKASAQQQPEFIIKFATIAPDNTPWSNHLKMMQERIQKESDGRIKVNVFLSGALGGEVEMVRSLRRGRVQCYGGTAASVAEGAGIPEFQLLELPCLFDSLEEADYILDKVVFKDFEEILRKKGFKMAYWHENGWRNFATRKVQVRTPEDLRKLKMRSQESKVHLAMYKALGVQAEAIATPEVLGALQTGMVDGFDNTTLFSSASGWYEGIKYYTISEIIYQPGVILYSLDFFESMPKDLQKVLIGDPEKEMAWGRAAVREMNEPLLQNFKEEGITVYQLTPEEKEAFRKLLLPVHKNFEAEVGKDLLEKVYAGKKAFAQLAKK